MAPRACTDSHPVTTRPLAHPAGGWPRLRSPRQTRPSSRSPPPPCCPPTSSSAACLPACSTRGACAGAVHGPLCASVMGIRGSGIRRFGLHNRVTRNPVFSGACMPLPMPCSSLQLSAALTLHSAGALTPAALCLPPPAPLLQAAGHLQAAPQALGAAHVAARAAPVARVLLHRCVLRGCGRCSGC